MRIYRSYNELKNNTLNLGDIIDFGIDNCRKYKVCSNFLENQSFDGHNFNNDYIFRILKANKIDLAKKCYKTILTLHEDRPLFPECKVDGEHYQSLTNITLELFKIKENLENVWLD